MKDWQEEISYLIDTNHFRSAIVRDISGNSISQFKASKEEGSKKLKQDLLNFFKVWRDGMYNVEFKVDSNSTNPFVHSFNTSNEVNPVRVQGAPTMDNESIQKAIDMGIANGLEKHKFEQDKIELEQQKLEIQTAGGKLWEMLQPFIMSFTQSQTGTPLTVQGTTEEMQANAETRNKELDQESIEILTTYVPSEKLYSVAQRIKKDPTVIDKMEKLANLL